uniref:Putative asparagine synthase n=1 Tax=viral metagenome TaxID=1070528 RepID=A0A6H2A2H0_9ZZZZ
MVQLFGNKEIYCYNIACSTNHPDYIYSELAARYFNVDLIHWIPNQRKMKKRREDYPGDEIVREFYRWVYFDRKVYEIIACDGVDEFNCGYYAHMKNPTEETYYDFIRKLQKEQLIPLYKNSGKVRVFLPYISNEIILLWAQIPLSEKIDTTNRKKIICELSKRNNVPKEIIERHKYGFVDAMTIKGDII